MFLWSRGETSAKILLISVVIGTCLAGCSSSEKTQQPPDAAALLKSIPPSDPATYARIRDMRKWRNPYLIIRADGVGLLDPADNAEIVLKPEELLGALARLPASAWPYGRVVAASQVGVTNSDQQGIAIRRNKGIVGGILQRAQVAIDWVPSS